VRQQSAALLPCGMSIANTPSRHAGYRLSATAPSSLSIELMTATEAVEHRHAVKSAMAYIARHLSERIHLSDLSAAAGVSERTLGYIFVRAYGTTPMAFLKRERVSKARRLLEQSNPSKDTVADIARRCGFAHMGQFSLDYKRIVGESPSETLNRPPYREKASRNGSS
jgi:transcriptional regulator GlxA family with amidase domain